METKLLSDHAADLLEAAALLQQGKVVGIPTETVYGLAADARNPEVVRQIFAAKGRPADNPLIVHIAEMQALEQVAAVVPPLAVKLAERFWPGPLTMILPKRSDIPEITSGYGRDPDAVSSCGKSADPAVGCADRSTVRQHFRLSQSHHGTARDAGYARQDRRSG